jgi:23S rRNA pseudouridine1911/1915/1917 synthase
VAAELPTTFTVPAGEAGATLAAFLRSRLTDLSWSQIRRLVESRRVRIGGELCLDPARRLCEAETVELLVRPARKPTEPDAIRIRYLDAHIVVVEKPSGLSTVRHPAEREFSERRKALAPTLEDLVVKMIARQEKKDPKRIPRLRVVHRLDKETSGLVVFARTVAAERGLGRQFHQHTVTRRYLAVIAGYLPPQEISSRLVRDRGDGRRGSTTVEGIGKEATTHVNVVERLRGHTLLECRLETGRTHQIRIHLAEQGHPVCGEKVYNRTRSGEPIGHDCPAPRLALHAAELGFIHPVTNKPMRWEMPLPHDLEQFIASVRRKPHREAGEEESRGNQVDGH